MTKDWRKFIEKHPQKDVLFRIIGDIAKNDLASYDMKKLIGYKNLYRVRKGKIRIVFEKDEGENYIVAVDTRGDIYQKLSSK